RHGDDPTQADFFVDPVRGLDGQSLTLTVVYNNGKIDTATFLAGHSDPALAVAPPAPVPITWNGASARWLGQDGQDHSPGDVHVALAGLPPGRSVVAATLSDGVRGSWVDRGAGQSSYYADPYAAPLTFVASAADPTRGDFFFSPDRDES